MPGEPPRATRPSAAPPWRHAWVRHLRLPFNVLLSPIFLYGLAAGAAHAGQPVTWGKAAIGWLSLHVFLYGGANAYNSFHDRDEGPVGGMLRPPAVDPGLLPFSLTVGAAGLVPALGLGAPFALLWCLLAVGFVLYSRPVPRWKARPGPSLTAIGLGQGAGGFAAGWLLAAPGAALASPRALLAMAATTAVVTGLYLITQSYQTAEDRSRGDRTLPVLLGPPAALRLAVVVMAVGGVAVTVDLGRLAGGGTAAALALSFAGIGAALLRWAARFDERDVEANFHRAMAVAITAGATLGAALLAVLVGVAPESPHPLLIP